MGPGAAPAALADKVPAGEQRAEQQLAGQQLAGQQLAGEQEGLRPPPPLVLSVWQQQLWHGLAVLSTFFMLRYLWWRWTESLNLDALWYALPLVAAETSAALGLFVYFYALWDHGDLEWSPPEALLRPAETKTNAKAVSLDQGAAPTSGLAAVAVRIDIYITTLNEAPDLVALSLRDALALRLPSGVTSRVYVLDDGARLEMAAMAKRWGVGYLSRKTNEGYKAGNLSNALGQTDGDFIVICDADTRLLPEFLEETLGYFADPLVAWVQTPHWFYDIPQGRDLGPILRRRLPLLGGLLARALAWLWGPVRLGRDPMANDNRLFFEVIQKRRNGAMASFCCGAGSIHRRAALTRNLGNPLGRQTITRDHKGDVTAFNYHVSEDIFTSIRLHADPVVAWKSVLHSRVLSQQLSPQDLGSRFIQLFKYAGGSLDLCLNRGVLFARGLSLKQRLMYFSTFFGYLSCLHTLVLLFAPLVYLLTGISPVANLGGIYLLYFAPAVLFSELALLVASGGMGDWKARAWNVSLFALHLRALARVLRRKPIRFEVTPKQRQDTQFTALVWPNWLVVGANALGLVVAWPAFALGWIDYRPSALVLVSFFAVTNAALMLPMLYAAYWRPEAEVQS